MQLTGGGNDVVRYLVGIGLWCVYVLFLLFFTTVLLLLLLLLFYLCTMDVFLSEIKLDWLIDWLK